VPYQGDTVDIDLSISVVNLVGATALAILGTFFDKAPEGYQQISDSADDEEELEYGEKSDVVSKSNIVSKFTFGWLNPLLRRGYKKPLQINDLYQLPPTLTSDNIALKFEQEWDKEKVKSK
jgi:hypothetical protein